MAYCYTPIDSPMFFSENGDCGGVKHDLIVEKGDLKGSGINSFNSIISAVLIQLNSDQVFDGERGWWGDEFLGFPLGNLAWRIAENTPADKRTVRADAVIREALDPLIKQGMIDEIKIKTVQVVGGVEATVDILKNGQTIFRVTK